MKSDILLQTMCRGARNLMLCACLGLLSVYLPIPAAAQAVYSIPFTFTTLTGKVASGSAGEATCGEKFLDFKGLAVDVAGNVYMANFYNQTICRMTPAGIV